MSIRLPKYQTPTFPATCLGCGVGDPRHSVTIWTNSSNWWMIVTILAAFWTKFAKATVPMCKRCAWRLRFRRLGYGLYFAASAAVAILCTTHFFPRIPKLFGRLIAFATFALVMLPHFYLEYRWPPAIELYVDGDQVTYQFRDMALAIEFSELNTGRIEGLG